MTRYLLFFLLRLSSWPASAYAALSINEVAWMGSGVSANHEWIELYNDSASSVVVDGYRLTDNQNLNIILTGEVPASGFVVLERTSDESAPGTAFLIYTGALVNTGATLQLLNATGDIVDQVAGGEDWQNIGGDNITKETAQYTSQGWQTGTPTPGKENITSTSDDEDDESADEITSTTTNTNVVTSSNGASQMVLSREPKSSLQLSFPLPSQVYVNQPLDFKVTASGVGETIISSLRYVWNFGDATAERGQTATHSYEYPGTYVVTVRAQYAGRDVMARDTVTVLPVNFSLSRGSDGAVQINNNAQYEINLSGYLLKGQKSLLIPKDTILLPKSTITIPRSKVETNGLLSYLVLYDATRRPVAEHRPGLVQLGTAVQPSDLVVADESIDPSPISQTKSLVMATAETDSLAGEGSLLPEAEAAPILDNAALTPPENTSPQGKKWPYWALASLIIGAIIIVWSSPKSTLAKA